MKLIHPCEQTTTGGERKMMLRAVIVDDEQPAIDLLRILLEDTGSVQCVGEYCKPSEAANNIAVLKPDIVFLDVQMPGISGVELAGYILDQSIDTNIVFVTAYSEYAVQAFELNAVDYLLKPALPNNVARAVERVLKLKRLSLNSSPNSNGELAGAQIHCFGKLEVRQSPEGSLIKWRTAKVEELFAFLLYHCEIIVPKGKIIDSLWPESEPEIADTNLHTSVYKMKKIIKENGLDISVKFINGGYVMQLGPDVNYDVISFNGFVAKDTTLTQDSVSEFEKMAELYQGGYLGSKGYLWSMAERARLERYYAELAKQLARYYVGLAQFVKAEQILLRSIGYQPYDEDAYEQLLKVCSLHGDRHAIIKYYEGIQDTLQRELGIEPRPSLKRLYESIMNSL